MFCFSHVDTQSKFFHAFKAIRQSFAKLVVSPMNKQTLLKTNYLPILVYTTEACPMQSLEFAVTCYIRREHLKPRMLCILLGVSVVIQFFKRIKHQLSIRTAQLFTEIQCVRKQHVICVFFTCSNRHLRD